MNQNELQNVLDELMLCPIETEWLEFKEAKSNFDFDDLGRYFSALSNEANLNRKPSGWLIFGVTDKRPRQIVGSNYRLPKPGLDKLKSDIAKHTNHGITFSNIHELSTQQGRVIMFQIPPAPKGIPTEWKGRAYGREHESLVPLSLWKIEEIRRQSTYEDWSSQIVEGATIDDLDPEAVKFAREKYREKHPTLSSDLDEWDHITFLNKAKILIRGKTTKTAIILLGKYESECLLYPAIARITWVLKDPNGIEEDYSHFGPPLILAIDKVFNKVRDLTYRYMRNGSLFPTEISKYDSWVIRESLHNCIAHQDYSLGGRINVIEEADSLLFTNMGDFMPGNIEEVIKRDAPPELYRNRFLTDAMLNLNMIDTIGGGIKKMFSIQRKRNFPMPDYDLSEPQRVKVRIFGRIIDENYTRLLTSKTDLNLMDVIALDKVQKGRALSDSEFKSLKFRNLIEGRRPNLFVSAQIAEATDLKAEYINKRAFDKKYYKDVIIDCLKRFSKVTRSDIDKMLWKKISDALTDRKKKNFITNLLQEMRREKSIMRVEGKRGRGARWTLYKNT